MASIFRALREKENHAPMDEQGHPPQGDELQEKLPLPPAAVFDELD